MILYKDYIPITATSATPGIPRIVFSNSAGATFMVKSSCIKKLGHNKPGGLSL